MMVMGTAKPDMARCKARWAVHGSKDHPDFLTPLGSPIGVVADSIDRYWEQLYNDVKTRLCKWHRLGYHSQAGKIMVCKVMLVSMATYNFSTHLPRAVASQTGWQGDKRSNASCTLATSLFDPSQWLAGAGGVRARGRG